MSNSLGNQVLSASYEILERVGFFVQFTLLVPVNAFFASASNHGLGNDPSLLHR